EGIGGRELALVEVHHISVGTAVGIAITVDKRSWIDRVFGQVHAEPDESRHGTKLVGGPISAPGAGLVEPTVYVKADAGPALAGLLQIHERILRGSVDRLD